MMGWGEDPTMSNSSCGLVTVEQLGRLTVDWDLGMSVEERGPHVGTPEEAKYPQEEERT
jgi:hypothetical protein